MNKEPKVGAMAEQQVTRHNVKREELLSEVKEEYQGFIYNERQQHFHETTSGITPESYYGDLYERVSEAIKKGKFDNCKTGREIVNKVASDKQWLS